MLSNFKVSITGADSDVSIESLIDLGKEFPFVEWGILYSPSKQNSPRYPDDSWRKRFSSLAHQNGLNTAIHLCSNEIYDQILKGSLGDAENEILFDFSLAQININARDTVYSDKQICQVYDDLHYSNHIILQEHDGTRSAIDAFLARTCTDLEKVSILQDASRGKGIVATGWAAPRIVNGVALPTGFAGGVSDTNIDQMLDRVLEALEGSPTPERAWIDMESGVRTDDSFDLKKVEAVLSKASLRLNEFVSQTRRLSAQDI